MAKAKKKAEVVEVVEVAEGANPNQMPLWQDVIDGLKSAKTSGEAKSAVAVADKYLSVALKSDPNHRKVKTAKKMRDELHNAWVNKQ